PAEAIPANARLRHALRAGGTRARAALERLADAGFGAGRQHRTRRVALPAPGARAIPRAAAAGSPRRLVSGSHGHGDAIPLSVDVEFRRRDLRDARLRRAPDAHAGMAAEHRARP